MAKEAAPPQGSASAPTTVELMDWVESAYPQFFPPSSQPTLFSSPYTYRYYPATGNYLGVAGQDVFVLGPVSAGVVARVGGVADFTCRVLPQNCAASVAGPGPQVLFAADIRYGVVAVTNTLNPQPGTTLSGTLFSGGAGIGYSLAYDAARDRLYLPTSFNSVQVFDGASVASGAVGASRTIIPAGVSFIGSTVIFLDKVNDVLYMGGGRTYDGAIAVFNNASNLNGVITPNRLIVPPDGVHFFTIDTARSIAYVVGAITGVVAIPNINTLNGKVTSYRRINPIPNISGSGLAIDAARDRLYVASVFDGVHILNNASTATGAAALTTVRILGAQPQFVTLDAANDRLYVGAYTKAYVLNAASALGASTVPPAAIGVFTQSGSSIAGFAFP